MGNSNVSFLDQIEIHNKSNKMRNISPLKLGIMRKKKRAKNKESIQSDHHNNNNLCQNSICQCFKSDKHVKIVKVKRDMVETWKWTNNHSLSLLTSDTISDLDDIFPIQLITTIVSFIKNDKNCKYRHGKILKEFNYSDFRFLINKKPLCKSWYHHKYDNISQLLSLNIRFIGKGTEIAAKIIQKLCDESLPELRPSYLNDIETRRTLMINDCKIRLNIKNETCSENISEAQCSLNSITMNSGHDSIKMRNIKKSEELVILTIKSGSSKELYQIQQYFDKILQINGTVKNCIVLQCPSLYKMYNDDCECIINKIELFCKHWNVRCINIGKNKNLFSSFFTYCIKYIWFCDVTQNY